MTLPGSQSSLLSNLSNQTNFIASNISNINLNPIPQQQQQATLSDNNTANVVQFASNTAASLPPTNTNPTTFASTFAYSNQPPTFNQQHLTHPPQQPVLAQQYTQLPSQPPMQQTNLPTTANLFKNTQPPPATNSSITSSIPANISFTPLPPPSGLGQSNFLQQFKLESNLSNLNLNSNLPNPGVVGGAVAASTDLNATANTNQMVHSLVQQTISNHFNQQQLQQQQQKLFDPTQLHDNTSHHGHSHDDHGHSHGDHEHSHGDHGHSHGDHGGHCHDHH